jgi:hypothetical protein
MNRRIVEAGVSGFLLMVTVGTLATSTFGQNSKITSELFERITAKYKAFLEKEPHRVWFTHEIFPYESAKEPEKISVWKIEYLPPGREHSYYGLNSTDPGDKFERIVIGKRIFTNRDGKWKELEQSDGGMGLSSGPDGAAYFLRGSDKIGDYGTTVYEVITGSRFARGGGPWQTSYYRSRYWISEDGRIRKYVGESDALISKRSRTTEVYEYDPRIKIDAPIK